MTDRFDEMAVEIIKRGMSSTLIHRMAAALRSTWKEAIEAAAAACAARRNMFHADYGRCAECDEATACEEAVLLLKEPKR